MVRLLVIILFILFSNISIFSQINQNEEQSFEPERKDTARANRLLFDAKKLNEIGETDSAIILCNDAINLFDTVTHKKLTANIYKTIAEAYFYKNELYPSTEYDIKALNIYISLNDTINIIKGYRNVGADYNFMSNFELAARYTLQALSLLEEQDSLLMEKAMTLSNMGSIYLGSKEFEKALTFLHQSRELFDIIGDDKMKLSNLNNIGNAYQHLEQLDTAEYYFKVVLKEAVRLDLPKSIIYTNLNLSELYLKMNRKKESFDCAEKAVLLSEELLNVRLIVISQLAVGETLYSMKRFNESLQHLKKGLKIADESNDLEVAFEITKLLHKIYSKLGNHKEAYNLLLKHKQLSDSLVNAENIRALTTAELEYEFNRKQQKSVQQAKQKEYEQNLIIESQKYQKRIAFGAIFLIVIILALLFILYNSSQKRKQHKLREALYMNMQQTLSQQMNPHFIFNTLSSIQNFILQNNKEESMEYLVKFANLMRKMLHASQKYTVGLNDEIKLLTDYCELEALRFKNGLTFNINIDESIEPKNIQIPVFLLQPLIENAIKHGLEALDGKGIIILKIMKTDEGINCSVEDNGIGIKGKGGNGKHQSVAGQLINKRLSILSMYFKKNFEFSLDEIKSPSGNVLGSAAKITIPVV